MEESMCPLTQMVMQENIESLGRWCHISSERVEACIALHPRVLVVGEYKLVSRDG